MLAKTGDGKVELWVIRVPGHDYARSEAQS